MIVAGGGKGQFAHPGLPEDRQGAGEGAAIDADGNPGLDVLDHARLGMDGQLPGEALIGGLGQAVTLLVAQLLAVGHQGAIGDAQGTDADGFVAFMIQQTGTGVR